MSNLTWLTVVHSSIFFISPVPPEKFTVYRIHRLRSSVGLATPHLWAVWHSPNDFDSLSLSFLALWNKENKSSRLKMAVGKIRWENACKAFGAVLGCIKYSAACSKKEPYRNKCMWIQIVERPWTLLFNGEGHKFTPDSKRYLMTT